MPSLGDIRIIMSTARQVFKVTYINNKVLSVNPAENIKLKKEYTFEVSNDLLIHAFVKASDINEAKKMGDQLKEQFLRSKQL